MKMNEMESDFIMSAWFTEIVSILELLSLTRLLNYRTEIVCK